MSSQQSVESSSSTGARLCRRLIDVVGAATGLMALSPVLCVAALWIKLDSRGPILHRAIRVGRNGEPFRLLKFRSMVPRAATQGPGITLAADQRITRAGRWLRRTKVDELPQLLNVLRGEMSLVGPRPEDPRYVVLYTPEQRRVLAHRPGVTSAASLMFRNESELLTPGMEEAMYTAEVLPAKLKMDMDYLSQRTIASDLRMIGRTLWLMIHRLFERKADNRERP